MYCNFSNLNVIFEDRLSPPTPTHTHGPSPSPIVCYTQSSAIPRSCPSLLPHRHFDELLCNYLQRSCHCRRFDTLQQKAALTVLPHTLPPPLSRLPHPLYVRSAHLLLRFRKLCKEPQKKQSAVRCCLHVVFVHVIKYQMTPPRRTTPCHAPSLLLLLPGGPGQV